MKSQHWVLLWSLWAARLVRQPTAPVRVSGGWVRGQVASDGSHLRYTGIPYATYEHRFQVIFNFVFYWFHTQRVHLMNRIVYGRYIILQ